MRSSAVIAHTGWTRGQPPPAHTRTPALCESPAADHNSRARVCSHLTRKWRHMEMPKGEEVEGFNACTKSGNNKKRNIGRCKHILCTSTEVRRSASAEVVFKDRMCLMTHKR